MCPCYVYLKKNTQTRFKEIRTVALKKPITTHFTIVKMCSDRHFLELHLAPISIFELDFTCSWFCRTDTYHQFMKI